MNTERDLFDESDDEKCPTCGEVLSDFTPCACSFTKSPRSSSRAVTSSARYTGGGMRQMVADKLARKAVAAGELARRKAGPKR